MTDTGAKRRIGDRPLLALLRSIIDHGVGNIGTRLLVRRLLVQRIGPGSFRSGVAH